MHIKIIDTIQKHNTWRNNCINLVPSENVLSPSAKEAIQSDMGQRYYFTNAFKPKRGASYSYRGTKYISEIITIGEKIARELFNASYASLYMLSGHQTNIAILFAFCKKGDTILCYDPASGGYPGLDRSKLPKYLGLNVEYIPVELNMPEIIDTQKTKNIIEDKKPKLLILSSANTLFPFPLKELNEVCKRNKCILVYDASHPLGLIAGNQFQNPISEGADILLGGTQKSFPGPQGGIILTNNYKNKIQEVEHFVMVDNSHFNRIAALTVTLLEMKHFGNAYSKQVIKNAKCLAENLEKRDLPICYKELGYTQSHMFKINTFKDYKTFTKKLEKANIIMDNSGRVGISEMTRYGIKEPEIETIAKFISRIYNNEDPYKVKKDVIEFRKAFQIIEYCFK